MNLWVVYPALALILGVLTSVYLFVAWFRPPPKRPPFLLYWSGALFLMYWFQVPVILTNLGSATTVTAFNFFFAITFPITFLALIFIYRGVLDALDIRISKTQRKIFFLWSLAAMAFFAYHFITRQGVINSYTLPLIGNIVFYFPLRSLTALTLVWWVWRAKPKNLYGVLGVCFIIAESLLGIFRNFLIIKYVLLYPPQFWYVVLSGLKIFFILQTASIILLVFGFFFLHRACCGREN